MTGITQVEFARQAGISTSSVHGAVKKGRLPFENKLVQIPDGVTPKELWDATASDAPRHQANKDRLDALKSNQEAIPDGSAAQLVKLASAMKLETYKLQKAKAEIANLELDKAAGALVERDAVDLIFADLGAITRNIIEHLPTRLYAVHGGDHAKVLEIEAVAAAILSEIGDHLMREADKL